MPGYAVWSNNWRTDSAISSLDGLNKTEMDVRTHNDGRTPLDRSRTLYNASPAPASISPHSLPSNIDSRPVHPYAR
jgi:hypothetical protein